MEADVLWGLILTLAVIGVLGYWFHRCGRADRARNVRAFAKRSLLYAGVAFALGVAFLTSDLGNVPPQQRLGLVAFTVCSFLLLYAAGSAMIAANDQAIVLINLTGRPLLMAADPDLAPFYTLPAPQEKPAEELPPIRPRTCYVVSTELGRIGAQAGRTDLFTVDAAGALDCGDARHTLRVRRLVPVAALLEKPRETSVPGV